MNRISYILIALLLGTSCIMSQQDSTKTPTDSLSIKLRSAYEKWLNERKNNSGDSTGTVISGDSLSNKNKTDLHASDSSGTRFDNALTLNKSKKKRYGRWEADDLVFEYVLGGGMGILGGLIGGMLGSFAHTAGDTSQSGNETTVDVVMVMMSIGHAIGTPFGVNMAAKKNGAKGEILLGILGTLIGDAGGIYLIAKGRKWPGIGVITLVTPLISTLLFNLADGSK